MAWGNGYTYRRAITIDNTKVSGTSNFTNFPILIKDTYSYLATTGNGGKVENANGYDVIFTSDAAGSTQIDHEVELYTATTGAVVYHVEVPTLQYGSDTTIYMFYGNSSISVDQSSATGVWNSSYKGVYHMGDASGNVTDSTSNAKDMTAGGTGGSYQQTGKVHYAVATAGTLEFNRQTVADLTTEDYVTMEVVTQVSSFTTNGMVFFHGDLGYMFIRFDSTDKLLFYAKAGGNYYNITQTGYSTATWYHIFARFRKNDNIYLQVNGVDITSAANGTGNLDDEGVLKAAIGNYEGAQNFNGLIDEARLITGDIGADWGKTSYETLFNPGTFYSVGSEQTSGGGGSTFVPRVTFY